MLVSYNGITLPYSSETEVTQEVVYDDFSHADAVAVKFVVVSRFLISAEYLRLMAPAVYAATDEQVEINPLTVMNALARKLREPRKALSLRVGDEEMVPVNPRFKKGTADAANGPMPAYLKITQLLESTFVCEYKIEATYVDVRYVKKGDGVNILTDASNPGGGVLYNRWEESVSHDELEYSTRTRKGRVTIRADSAEFIHSPDEFRSKLAVLSIPKGFVRQSYKYAVSGDGLSLDYEIVDKEVYEYPPAGALKAEGYYKEYGRSFNSAIRYAECRVKLWGGRLSRKDELVLTAIFIVGNKMADAGAALGVRENVFERLKRAAQAAARGGKPPVDRGQSIAQSIELTIDLYQNTVEYRVLGRFVGNKRSVAGLPGIRKHFCTPPAGGAQPTYRERGSAALLLQAAEYWNKDKNLVTMGRGLVRTSAGGGRTSSPAVSVEKAEVSMNAGKNKPGAYGNILEGEL